MRHLAQIRLTIGLVQGATLWLLYRAFEARAWPATDPTLFAPLLAVSVFVPVLVLLGLGNARGRVALAWAAAAAALCAGLALHDVTRGLIGTWSQRQDVPGPALWLVLLMILFMGHVLVVSADADRKLIPGYARHFDLAWKLGLQLALGALFVAIVWILLWLGAELFRLIRIEYFRTLITTAWFWVPVTTLTFSLAVHVTDSQAGIVRGVRTLALTLFGWLLPLMVLIVVGFLLALPFTGLEPIWSTRHATALMLSAATALVFLINAAYQDGDEQRSVSPPLRWAGRAAALALGPLVVIAAYGLILRVRQYGWSVDRIFAATYVVGAGCYALGYAVAALRPGRWLSGIEVTNVATSLVILALLVALFTPLADPARLAVQDQVARLLAGRVSPDRFDFNFLRFRSGRYGMQALEQLKDAQGGPEAERISRLAQQALAVAAPYARAVAPSVPLDRSKTIVALGGQTVPESFLRQDWSAVRSRISLPPCLTRQAACEAALLDLDDDGSAEIVLFPVALSTPAIFNFGATVFKRGSDHTWMVLGSITNAQCPGLREAARRGEIRVVPPDLKDVEINGQRLRVTQPCR